MRDDISWESSRQGTHGTAWFISLQHYVNLPLSLKESLKLHCVRYNKVTEFYNLSLRDTLLCCNF